MRSYNIEKTIRENGEQSVVLVNEELEVVEEVELFLNYLEKRGRSLNTRDSYCRDLKEYFNWLAIQELKFYEVNKRSLISWIDFIKLEVGKTENKSPITINRYLASVASFYNYYEGIGGYIDENPISIQSGNNINYSLHKIKRSSLNINFFRQKEKKSQNTRRMLRNQIELFYQEIGNVTNDTNLIVRNKLLYRFIYETGCRIGEALGIRVMDYSVPDPTKKIGCIYIRRHLPYYHKDHSLKTNERDIPVSMDLIYALDEYVCLIRPQKEGIETIFVNHGTSNKGNYMTRGQINKLFKKVSENLNIKCSPHMLRHTHGTELKENGYSEMYIMDRLGHNSLESTKKYMHISYESQSIAYEGFIRQRNRVNFK